MQLTDANFANFNYRLPDSPAEAYATQALDILQQFEKLDVVLLPYFLAADIVLTLSGVRAFDAYITFENLNDPTIQSFEQLLTQNGLTLFPHHSEYGTTPVDTYLLMHHAALQKIPDQYGLQEWVEPHPPFNFDRLMGWTYYVESNLFAAMSGGKLPKAWAKNHWAAHNIRFGILLGYPGEAIAAGCWTSALGEKDSPRTQTAVLAYHDAYDAAWPNYDFVESIKDNPNIVNHQKLWSDILSLVYESPWHKKLQQNSTFTQAATKISKLKQ